MEFERMLVLSRKRDERIAIGPDVQVCVIEIRGDKVSLGIEAPQDVPIYRKEVLDRAERNAEFMPLRVYVFRGANGSTRVCKSTAIQAGETLIGSGVIQISKGVSDGVKAD